MLPFRIGQLFKFCRVLVIDRIGIQNLRKELRTIPKPGLLLLEVL